jgi:hypothetical protein
MPLDIQLFIVYIRSYFPVRCGFSEIYCLLLQHTLSVPEQISENEYRHRTSRFFSVPLCGIRASTPAHRRV